MAGQDFVTISNPYIVGNPVEERSMFFGREDDFLYLQTKLAGAERGGMIVLCGTRRSGKTSILFQILQGRLGAGFVPVLIDMQSVAATSAGGFVTDLVARIAAALDLEPETAGGDDPAAAEQALRAFMPRAAQALGERSLVLMFDEYELFETNIEEGRLSARVLALLGELIRGEAGVYILFAGSDKLEERRADYWSETLGHGQYRRVSFLSRRDALRLVTEPVAGRATYASGLPERIYELAAGQPFYTQVICQALVDQLNEQQRTAATFDDLDHVVAGVIDNPLPHMIFTWSSLGDAAKVALAALADLRQETGGYATPEEITAYLADQRTGIRVDEDVLREALEKLFVDDLLAKATDGGSYAFRLDLWRLWVGRMHTIWQVIDEIFTSDREPDEGVERLSRRRLRLLLAVVGAGLLVAAAVFLKPVFFPPDEVVRLVVPDSTWVSVATEPPGAEVFWDNHLLGESPIDSVRIPAGPALLLCQLEGYATTTDSVSADTTAAASFSISLRELVGSVRFESNPAGARVTLDGRALTERTPVTVEGLPVRLPHAAVFELSQHRAGSYDPVRVLAGSLVTVSHDFRRRTFPLRITTTPAGAELLVDGTSRGESPQSLGSITEGTHGVTARLFGYAEEQRRVEVPVQGNELHFDLQLMPRARLEMIIRPFAEEILLDGRSLVARPSGIVRYGVDLEQGVHVVELRHTSLPTRRDTVSVDWGDTVNTVYDLREGAP